jgi:hypothetical protein
VVVVTASCHYPRPETNTTENIVTDKWHAPSMNMENESDIQTFFVASLATPEYEQCGRYMACAFNEHQVAD